MRFIVMIGQFISNVGVPTVVDVLAAIQKSSDGGKKITPEERDDILERAGKRVKDWVLSLLPVG